MTTPERSPHDEQKELPAAVVFLTLGTTIACTLGVFVVLGIVADNYFGTSPWCLLIGVVLGGIAATASTIALVRKNL